MKVQKWSRTRRKSGGKRPCVRLSWLLSLVNYCWTGRSRPCGASGGVLKPVRANISNLFLNKRGQKRRVLRHPGTGCAEKGCKTREEESLVAPSGAKANDGLAA